MEYIKEAVTEILRAVTPIVVLVIILILVFVPNPIPVVIQFSIGSLMVMSGLGTFLLGVKVGLLPLGEAIGAELPQWGSMVWILSFVAILGVAVTIAEPDVRVLAVAVDKASGGEISKNMLIMAVAMGVGISLIFAVARVVLNIPLSYILIAGYTTIFILSYFVPDHFVPISFDSGGVTTGPMTAPFLLALGVGFASVLGGKCSLENSFGYVALASIGPVLSVMILGVTYR